MSGVFVSYARPDEPLAQQVAAALRSLGHEVWRDDELPAHRAYSEVIEERLRSAKAVVVLWSAEAAKSQWVRAEAEAARSAGTLIQASIDGCVPPLPFNQIQCADLKEWDGKAETAGWRKIVGSVAALAGPSAPAESAAPRARSVCVLPFANMSGDPEQEYFSDGISEDITTDLSKVSALAVTARNTAFTFKGKAVDVPDLAKKLGVSHVLEGSVRKAGMRVRITAQLIDGKTGDHVWAERYDRDLTDIFAIQDEISKAIVEALKLKLLPEEKKAIEERGTTNADAYNIYLLARHQWVAGSQGNPRREAAVVSLCEQAIRIDENYAEAWALMALAQADSRYWHGRDVDPVPAADRAIQINPRQAQAYCVKARYLEEQGRSDEAEALVRTALSLEPDLWEVNREAARMLFRHGRVRDSVPFFRRAADLMETDWNSPMMLVSCYNGMGDEEDRRGAARIVLQRAERAISQDGTNGSAAAAGAAALAVLGEMERSQEWGQRALLLEPDNLHVHYNVACTFLTLGRADQALDTLELWFARASSATRIRHALADPDLDPVRQHSRFQTMLGGAKKRLAMS